MRLSGFDTRFLDVAEYGVTNEFMLAVCLVWSGSCTHRGDKFSFCPNRCSMHYTNPGQIVTTHKQLSAVQVI